MKKIVLLAVAAGAAFAVYRKVTEERAERDLWTEATSAPDLR